MAALTTIAKEWANELRDGIAWVIVWKTGRSWNAQAVWLDAFYDTFELEDVWFARKVLELDSHAVILNGYYCGHFHETMTISELAAGIRWHYENGCNLLAESTAFPSEPIERPANLPADMPWYDSPTTKDIDPYVYDGHMSVQDYEVMQTIMDFTSQQSESNSEEDTPIQEPLSTNNQYYRLDSSILPKYQLLKRKLPLSNHRIADSEWYYHTYSLPPNVVPV